ncbi:MAG: DUF58 domain-containing protein [Planctomycetota bacterium]|jgi:uncharacterized protein (DUF58 family)
MSNLLQQARLHIPGLVFCAVVALLGLTAVNNQNNLMFWLFAVMLGSVVLSWVAATLMIRGLTVRRLDPKHGAVGEPLNVRYEVTNRRRLLPVFNVHFEDLAGPDERDWSRFMPPARAWIMHVGPRETVHGEAVFWPVRRGEVQFDRLRVWTTFPFGIFRRSRTISRPQHTLIYPRLFELRRGVLDSVTPRGPVGIRVSQRSGGGDDYYGMREYRPGDSMRHIAWKRLAKIDALVSIERSQPSPPRLRVVLDLRTHTRDLPAAEPDPRQARGLEEQAICLAASLVHAADLAGFEIGLELPGTDLPAIPVRRSHWHLAKIMAALAAIDLDAPRRPGRVSVGQRYERSGSIVVHADRSEALPGLEDAWYLTGRQLSTLAVRPIGWDPLASRPAPSSAPPSATPEAAA